MCSETRRKAPRAAARWPPRSLGGDSTAFACASSRVPLTAQQTIVASVPPRPCHKAQTSNLRASAAHLAHKLARSTPRRPDPPQQRRLRHLETQLLRAGDRSRCHGCGPWPLAPLLRREAFREIVNLLDPHGGAQSCLVIRRVAAELTCARPRTTTKPSSWNYELRNFHLASIELALRLMLLFIGPWSR